ncbi:hypothetical protein O9Z70_04130 [Devosia sp. YIM 151766]|uniref:hypothetical protein n=1 Tax=Devosia sp. YIM 151766 TaxID=3017325 RepID=UPI00255CF406|nr:hypothetical protein [Devosia sp. YIM 151766]WIY53738.1 hypothetical protein O9Z70_04130 [Devosia sp. YIM 151766]
MCRQPTEAERRLWQLPRDRRFGLLRLWNNDILARPGNVAEGIWAALENPR